MTSSSAFHGGCEAGSTSANDSSSFTAASEPLLKRARQLGVLLTLGSDAHAPTEVGRNFDQAVALARSAGYDQVLRISRRRAERLPIEPI